MKYQIIFGVLLIATVAHAEPLRIMPLGDSMTAGNDNFNLTPGGYRTTLYSLLHEAGYEFDFVGGMSDNPSPMPDNDHEGHGGWTLQQIRQGFVASLVAHQPDVVLLLAGTNDVTWSLYLTPELTAAEIAGRLEALLSDLYFARPNAVVFVGTIPQAAASEAEHVARSAEVNTLYPSVVESQALLGRLVHLVDVRGALSQDDLADSLHPSPAGYAKLGQLWFDALQSVVPPTIYHLDSGPLRFVENRTVPEPSTLALLLVAILTSRAHRFARACQLRPPP